MKVEPRVSIITPTFNHEQYISACIESVRQQTFEDWELIVIDDGSSDRTVALVRQFASSDSRIRLIEQDNVGIFKLGGTYNRALETARGEYIAVLEGDDLWEAHKLAVQVEGLDSDESLVLSWGDAEIVTEDLEPLKTQSGLDTDCSEQLLSNRPTGIILTELYMENLIPAVTLTVRREALERLGGFQQVAGLPLVDYPTLLDLATLGPFFYVNEVIATWRWHRDQITKSYHLEILERVRDLAVHHYDALPDHVKAILKIDRTQIVSHHRELEHHACIQSGRYKLAQRRFKDARADFRRALWYPDSGRLTDRAAALVGIGASLLRVDLEWAARLLGKPEIG